MSSDYERTLCQLPHVHAFRIPARKSSEGYRAADWPKDPIWTGKLKITAKDKLAVIYLIDESNKTFATCPVTDDSAVERCLDSGRYFVIKIQNAQGKHAFIGIAFNERNDAFDFNVALSEHKSECEREEKAEASTDVADVPSRDLSLREGQKIKVNLVKANKEKKPNEGSSTSSGGGLFLAPPPGDKKSTSGGLGFLAPPPRDNSKQGSTGSQSQGSSSSGSDNLLDF